MLSYQLTIQPNKKKIIISNNNRNIYKRLNNENYKNRFPERIANYNTAIYTSTIIGQTQMLAKISTDFSFLVRDLQIIICEFFLKSYERKWILEAINNLSNPAKYRVIKFIHDVSRLSEVKLQKFMNYKFNSGSI